MDSSNKFSNIYSAVSVENLTPDLILKGTHTRLCTLNIYDTNMQTVFKRNESNFRPLKKPQVLKILEHLSANVPTCGLVKYQFVQRPVQY